MPRKRKFVELNVDDDTTPHQVETNPDRSQVGVSPEPEAGNELHAGDQSRQVGAAWQLQTLSSRIRLAYILEAHAMRCMENANSRVVRSKYVTCSYQVGADQILAKENYVVDGMLCVRPPVASDATDEAPEPQQETKLDHELTNETEHLGNDWLFFDVKSLVPMKTGWTRSQDTDDRLQSEKTDFYVVVVDGTMDSLALVPKLVWLKLRHKQAFVRSFGEPAWLSLFIVALADLGEALDRLSRLALSPANSYTYVNPSNGVRFDGWDLTPQPRSMVLYHESKKRSEEGIAGFIDALRSEGIQYAPVICQPLVCDYLLRLAPDSPWMQIQDKQYEPGRITLSDDKTLLYLVTEDPEVFRDSNTWHMLIIRTGRCLLILPRSEVRHVERDYSFVRKGKTCFSLRFALQLNGLRRCVCDTSKEGWQSQAVRILRHYADAAIAEAPMPSQLAQLALEGRVTADTVETPPAFHTSRHSTAETLPRQRRLGMDHIIASLNSWAVERKASFHLLRLANGHPLGDAILVPLKWVEGAHDASSLLSPLRISSLPQSLNCMIVTKGRVYSPSPQSQQQPYLEYSSGETQRVICNRLILGITARGQNVQEDSTKPAYFLAPSELLKNREYRQVEECSPIHTRCETFFDPARPSLVQGYQRTSLSVIYQSSEHGDEFLCDLDKLGTMILGLLGTLDGAETNPYRSHAGFFPQSYKIKIRDVLQAAWDYGLVGQKSS